MSQTRHPALRRAALAGVRPIVPLALDGRPSVMGKQGEMGHYFTAHDGKVIFVADDSGFVPHHLRAGDAEAKRFSRAGLERHLVEHHRAMGGDSIGESDAFDRAGRGHGHTVFHKQLPGEVTRYLEGNPAARRLFSVTQDAGGAGGADAMHDMGEDAYFAHVDRLHGSDIRAAKRTAESSDDPEVQFLSRVHDNLPGGRSKIVAVKAGELRVGAKFTLHGHEFRVAQDEHGHRVLQGGVDYGATPLDALRSVPTDAGSFRQGKIKFPGGRRRTSPPTTTLPRSAGSDCPPACCRSRAATRSTSTASRVTGGRWRTINGSSSPTVRSTADAKTRAAHHRQEARWHSLRAGWARERAARHREKGNGEAADRHEEKAQQHDAVAAQHEAAAKEHEGMPAGKVTGKPSAVAKSPIGTRATTAAEHEAAAEHHVVRAASTRGEVSAAHSAAASRHMLAARGMRNGVPDRDRQQRSDVARRASAKAEAMAADKPAVLPISEPAKPLPFADSVNDAAAKVLARGDKSVSEQADKVNGGPGVAKRGGSFGSDKAFIGHVYRQYLSDRRNVAIPISEFKAKLVEANTAGTVKLSRADLVAAMHPEDVKEAETKHPIADADFHFVNVKPAARYDADAAGTSGVKPGLFGQPTVEPVTGRQQPMFGAPAKPIPIALPGTTAADARIAAKFDPKATPPLPLGIAAASTVKGTDPSVNWTFKEGFGGNTHGAFTGPDGHNYTVGNVGRTLQVRRSDAVTAGTTTGVGDRTGRSTYQTVYSSPIYQPVHQSTMAGPVPTPGELDAAVADARKAIVPAAKTRAADATPTRATGVPYGGVRNPIGGETAHETKMSTPEGHSVTVTTDRLRDGVYAHTVMAHRKGDTAGKGWAAKTMAKVRQTNASRHDALARHEQLVAKYRGAMMAKGHANITMTRAGEAAAPPARPLPIAAVPTYRNVFDAVHKIHGSRPMDGSGLSLGGGVLALADDYRTGKYGERVRFRTIDGRVVPFVDSDPNADQATRIAYHAGRARFQRMLATKVAERGDHDKAADHQAHAKAHEQAAEAHRKAGDALRGKGTPDEAIGNPASRTATFSHTEADGAITKVKLDDGRTVDLHPGMVPASKPKGVFGVVEKYHVPDHVMAELDAKHKAEADRTSAIAATGDARQRSLADSEVPAYAHAAFERYGGMRIGWQAAAERAWGKEDEQASTAISRYGEAIEAGAKIASPPEIPSDAAVRVTGNTYANRSRLSRAGFKWDGNARAYIGRRGDLPDGMEGLHVNVHTAERAVADQATGAARSAANVEAAKRQAATELKNKVTSQISRMEPQAARVAYAHDGGDSKRELAAAVQRFAAAHNGQLDAEDVRRLDAVMRRGGVGYMVNGSPKFSGSLNLSSATLVLAAAGGGPSLSRCPKCDSADVTRGPTMAGSGRSIDSCKHCGHAWTHRAGTVPADRHTPPSEFDADGFHRDQSLPF